jgi:hypothetical protein
MTIFGASSLPPKFRSRRPWLSAKSERQTREPERGCDVLFDQEDGQTGAVNIDQSLSHSRS